MNFFFLLMCALVAFSTPWTVACRAPLFMGFSRQEYWSGLPFSSPGDLPDPGIKLFSPVSQADSLPFEPQGSPVLLSYRKYKMVGRARGSIRLTVSFFSWDCITGDVVYPPLGISSGAMLPPIIFSGMRGQCQWGQGCYQSYLFE